MALAALIMASEAAEDDREGLRATLPLAIHAALQRPGGEVTALRLSLLSIALSFAALIAAELMALRRP